MSEREIRNGGSGEQGSGTLATKEQSSSQGGQNGRDINQGGKNHETLMYPGHVYKVSK